MRYADVLTSLQLSSSSKTKFPIAVEFFRTMHGCTRASLVRCDDGKLYIVKCSNLSLNTLANETIGSIILSEIGICTPRWSPVYVSGEFIEANPQIAPSFVHVAPVQLAAGFYFGSEFVGQTRVRIVHEWLPASFSQRISNVSDFLGMYIFDVWANHCDTRQLLFTQSLRSSSFKAVFIDNGHLFGGPRWKHHQVESSAGRASSLHKTYYKESWNAQMISRWISRIRHSVDNTLPKIAPLIPQFWYGGDIYKLVEQQMERLQYLDRLFMLEMVQNKSFFWPRFLANHNAQIPLHSAESLPQRHIC